MGLEFARGARLGVACALLVALFRVHRRLLVSARYRQFKYDRTDGSGEDEVRQEVTVVGPSLGLSVGIF